MIAEDRDRSLAHKLSNILVAGGSPLAKVIDAVAFAEDDIILPKTSFGVFNSTILDYVLRNLGIENVVAGFVTDQCIDIGHRMPRPRIAGEDTIGVAFEAGLASERIVVATAESFRRGAWVAVYRSDSGLTAAGT